MKRVVACLVLAVSVAGCGGEDGESFDCAALGAELNRLDEQLADLKASERSAKVPSTIRTLQEEIRLFESDIRLIEADFRGVYGCSILDRFSSSGKRL